MNERSLLHYVLLVALATMLMAAVYWLLPDQPQYPNFIGQVELLEAQTDNTTVDYERFFDPNPVVEVYCAVDKPKTEIKTDLPPHLVGLEQGTWSERMLFIRQLPSTMEVAECEQLMTWLKSPMSPGEIHMDGHVIRNEAMSALRRQQKINQRLTEVLISIAQDANQDDTLRGYAVQHLSSWHEERDNPHHRELIRNCLWRLVADKTYEHGGTSLLALWRLSYLDNEINRSSLAETARKYVEGDDTLPGNIVAGLQVCAEMNVEAVLPAATRHMNISKYYTTRLTASRVVEKFIHQNNKESNREAL